jgi:hypothetical protein
MSDEQPATNMTADEVKQTIAEHLGETGPEPLQLLHKVVKKLGPEQALAFPQGNAGDRGARQLAAA